MYVNLQDQMRLSVLLACVNYTGSHRMKTWAENEAWCISQRLEVPQDDDVRFGLATLPTRLLWRTLLFDCGVGLYDEVNAFLLCTFQELCARIEA